MAHPGQGNPIADFVFGLPPITRALFTGTVATTLAGNFFIDIRSTLLYWPLVTRKWELWRLLTCFFTGKLGFNWAMGLYFLYRTSLDLERGHYAGRTADFAFATALIMIGSLAAGYLFELAVLTEPLLMGLMYLWSMLNPDTIMQFMFGMTFPAKYFPWVLVGWDVLMSGSVPTVKLLGIVIGHAVHYALVQYPAVNGGRALIPTPGFLFLLFPQGAGPTMTQFGFGVQPPRHAAGNAATRSWTAGGGRRLGD
ncbi:hypothetical protein H9P43_005917 [Blastocladiella emersonii ATCC 22665]|nr:hypothetical protein H9P43_005917 [Blastocladiella emersonii ATCC 22665]